MRIRHPLIIKLVGLIAAWVLREGGTVLPQIDRVDLYETRGSGAIVSRADSEELIPV